jgi:hypothetical protein
MWRRDIVKGSILAAQIVEKSSFNRFELITRIVWPNDTIGRRDILNTSELTVKAEEILQECLKEAEELWAESIDGQLSTLGFQRC